MISISILIASLPALSWATCLYSNGTNAPEPGLSRQAKNLRVGDRRSSSFSTILVQVINPQWSRYYKDLMAYFWLQSAQIMICFGPIFLWLAWARWNLKRFPLVFQLLKPKHFARIGSLLAAIIGYLNFWECFALNNRLRSPWADTLSPNQLRARSRQIDWI